jgi:phosphoglycolate phosphatase
MGKQLILFDMDGTLVDSSHLLVNTINHVRAQLSLPPMPFEIILSHVNDPHINPAHFFYEAEVFRPIHEQWFSEYYTAHHSRQLVLYPGIRQLIEELRERGLGIGLATNAYRQSTLESLRHLEIESCFDAIVCHDDVARPKPAPDMLEAILRALKIPRDAALFVGDGPRDEAAAQAAGVEYVMVDWGFTEHADDQEVVRSATELRERIEKGYL